MEVTSGFDDGATPELLAVSVLHHESGRGTKPLFNGKMGDLGKTSTVYTVFKTDVETSRGKLVLYLRYSDFRRLFEALEKEFPDSGFTFPEKRIYLLEADNLEPNFVRYRRQLLHEFVQSIMAVGKYAKHKIVVDFFAGSSQSTAHEPCKADEIFTIVPGPGPVAPFGSGGDVTGFTLQGWDRVRHAFEKNFNLGLEAGAQLVIYRKGKKIVDLTGHNEMAKSYTPDTLQCSFSCGKVLESLAIAMMVDQKVLSYDDKVAQYWPQFGAHGKDLISIADVLRHEGGCPFIADPSDISDQTKDSRIHLRDISDFDKVEKLLENAGLCRSGGQRAYHAITRGWILSSVVRRIDASKRSLGQYIQEEITDKLEVGIITCVPEGQVSKFATTECKFMSTAYNVAFKVLPAITGIDNDECTKNAFKMLRDKKSHFARSNQLIQGLQPESFFDKRPKTNCAEVLRSDATSTCIHATARALAKVNALIGGGGELDGVRLLSEEGVTQLMAHVKVENDAFFGMKTGFSQGGVCSFGSFEECPLNRFLEPKQGHSILQGYFGWAGYGGSFSVWNPETQIALAYVPNAISNDLIGGGRANRIIAAMTTTLEKEDAV